MATKKFPLICELTGFMRISSGVSDTSRHHGRGHWLKRVIETPRLIGFARITTGPFLDPVVR
jgi:hypothetical protein